MSDSIVELTAQVIPEMADCECSVRETDPSLSEPEVLDRALRQAVARLRFDLAAETLERLRWRVERVRTAAREAVQVSRELSEANAVRKAQQMASSWRTFLAADERTWYVREVTTIYAWALGPRCLIFESDGMARRVWEYPEAWFGLSDGDLEQLGDATV